MKILSQEHWYHFANDVELLLLLNLIRELRLKRQPSGILLSSLVLKSILDIDWVINEVHYTNDYSGFIDFIYTWTLRLAEQTKIGELKGIRVLDAPSVTVNALSVLFDGYKRENDSKTGFAEYASEIVEQAYKIKNLHNTEFLNSSEYLNHIDFDDVYGNADQLVEYIPDQIFILLSSNDENITELLHSLEAYLEQWSEDKVLDDTGIYFSVQIQNFHLYVSEQVIVKGRVSLPTSLLKEEGFSLIRIIKYLEYRKLIEPVDLGSKDWWSIKFLHTPITLASLVGSSHGNSDEKLFFYITGEIEYRGVKDSVTAGRKTYELLNMFKQSKNTPLSVADMIRECNINILKKQHYFRGEKDINDTIAQIRSKLKVKTGAYFPIQKKYIEGVAHWWWKE